MIIDQYTNSGESTAPELAKFILSRFVKNQSGVEQMEKELDSNERLVSEIVSGHIIAYKYYIYRRRKVSHTD